MDVETEAYIGIAGPLLGTAGALVCYLLARSWDSNLLLALSYAGFFINLFNLIPLSPFDGGRITAIVSPRVWLVGVPILVGLFFYRPSPMLILVAILAAPQVMKAWRYDAAAPENAAYYDVRVETKLAYGAYYLVLAGFLAIMAYDVHEMLGALRSTDAG
jgi:Zn-dependent protease